MSPAAWPQPVISTSQPLARTKASACSTTKKRSSACSDWPLSIATGVMSRKVLRCQHSFVQATIPTRVAIAEPGLTTKAGRICPIKIAEVLRKSPIRSEFTVSRPALCKSRPARASMPYYRVGIPTFHQTVSLINDATKRHRRDSGLKFAYHRDQGGNLWLPTAV